MTVDDIVMTLMATPEGRRDPYPHYERLRALAPVARSDIGGLWFLTGFDDCHNVLRDARFGKGDPNAPLTLLPGAAPRRRLRFAGKTMLLVDPPDHTRLRGLVSREFTPRRVERLRDGVERMCDELLDDIAEAGEVDLMDTLAFPLPVRVIGELLGVPEEDRDGFRPLVLAAAKSIEPDMTEEEFAAADAAGQQQADYFTQLIAERTAHPEDDLLSALIAVRDGTDRLDEEELIATAILLFAAGFETTTNLIGNGAVTLLQHPDQLDHLRHNPSLLASAVDEILRVESPVQLDLRIAFDDVDIADQRIEAGDAVVTMLGAANRDPAKIPDPDHFDITRGDVPLMSFATGIHYCLGANLARMEGRVVLQRLLNRFDTIELLDDQPAWRDRLTLRGLDHLHVRCA
jgi:cytochrome P450